MKNYGGTSLETLPPRELRRAELGEGVLTLGGG